MTLFLASHHFSEWIVLRTEVPPHISVSLLPLIFKFFGYFLFFSHPHVATAKANAEQKHSKKSEHSAMTHKHLTTCNSSTLTNASSHPTPSPCLFRLPCCTARSSGCQGLARHPREPMEQVHQSTKRGPRHRGSSSAPSQKSSLHSFCAITPTRHQVPPDSEDAAGDF